MRYRFAFCGAFFLGLTSFCQAGQALVAVAANFTQPAEKIVQVFKQETGHDIFLSFGSTGNFYSQIAQGAPFDVFLAADDSRPQQTARQGYGVEGSEFTYAIGKLVLWRTGHKPVQGEKALVDPSIRHIAYGDPETAPYGRAALEVMQALDVYDALKPKLVEGRNIEQTLQFVQTGNAEIGFVALAQVINRTDGTRWDIPQTLYQPIRQNAVLLKKGAGNEAAKGFLAFLKSPKAQDIIRKYGYALP